MMKLPLGLLIPSLLIACASTKPSTTDHAQIDVVTLGECGKSSAVIRELHSVEGHRIRAKAPPYLVPAGVYSIGVSCGTILDDHAACLDTQGSDTATDVAPYELVLRPQRRYTFSCTLMRRQHVVRLTESSL